MSWILIFIYFVGPTSAPKLEYHGTFATEAQCEKSYSEAEQSLHWYSEVPNYLCFPVGEKSK